MKKLFYLAALITVLACSAVSRPLAFELTGSIDGEPAEEEKIAAPARSFFSDIRLAGAGSDADSFVLRGESGPFSVILTVFVDLENIANTANTAKAKERNSFAKGTWVMIVNRADNYIGTLYGDLRDAKIRLAQDILTGVKTGRSTTAGLRILGGRDTYREVEANDVATLNFSSFTQFTAGHTYTEARLLMGGQPD